MTLLAMHYGSLWMASLALVPVALLAGILCCMGARRPATRHAIYLAVLVCFTAPLLAAAGVRASWPTRSGLAGEVPMSAPAPLNAQALPGRSGEHELVVAPRIEVSSPVEHLVADPIVVVKTAPVVEPFVPMIRRDACAQFDSDAGRSATASAFPVGASQTAAPSAAAVPKGSAPWLSGAVGALRQTVAAWKASLLEASEVVRALPPMPPVVWIAGIAVFALSIAVRLVRQGWFVRHALPANAEARAMAREAASLVGLAQMPHVRFTTHRSSPLVTCGARPCVVLPAALWEELDDASRRAVLVHELAHLARRDHWVRRLELLIGAAYWWHPVVWWVRRRLNEEADLACDVWVTTLLPHSRRAYAEALVRTTTFVGGQNRPGGRAPVGALGMATGPARRFGRRITMVMTERSRRRPSLIGGAMCALVAAVGMVVMPAVACPDAKEKEAPKVKEVHQSSQPAPASDESTFDRYMLERGEAASADAMRAFEDRMRAMEAELQQAARAMELRARELHAGAPADPTPPAWPEASAPVDTTWSASPSADEPSTERMTLHYHLPKGKLGPLTGLMSRSDVPILITPSEDKITVHATIPQHRVFYSFCVLINPEGVQVTNEEGNDVKFKHHTPEHDAALKGVSASAPTAPTPPAVIARVAPRAQAHAQEQAARAKQRSEVAKQQAEVRAQAQAQRRAAEAHRREAHKMRERAERARRQSDDDESAADPIDDRIEELQEHLEHLEEALRELHDQRAEESNADDGGQAKANRQSTAIAGKIERLVAELAKLEGEAARRSADAELAAAEADQLDDAADAADEVAEVIAEAIEDAMEEWEDAMAEFEEQMAEFQAEMEELDDADEDDADASDEVETGDAA